MEFPKQALKTLETDAREAAWRLAGSQFVKLTREPLVAFLAGQLGPDDPAMRRKVADFLKTEMGEAFVSAFLSLGLSLMPAQAGEIPQHLAKELRVRAMTSASDAVVDLIMGPLRQVISMYIQGAPEERAPAGLPAETASTLHVESPEKATIAEATPAQSHASGR
jgi:hypothetical protein